MAFRSTCFLHNPVDVVRILLNTVRTTMKKLGYMANIKYANIKHALEIFNQHLYDDLKINTFSSNREIKRLMKFGITFLHSTNGV